MTPRQRGAAYFLALLILGRLLDVLNLPFEYSPPETQTATAAADSLLRTPVKQSVETRAQAIHPDENAPQIPVRNTQTLAINHATLQDLQVLPGVGPALAQRIVNHRTEHGPLRSLQDLRRIKGIGPQTAKRLAPLVRFD